MSLLCWTFLFEAYSSQFWVNQWQETIHLFVPRLYWAEKLFLVLFSSLYIYLLLELTTYSHTFSCFRNLYNNQATKSLAVSACKELQAIHDTCLPCWYILVSILTCEADCRWLISLEETVSFDVFFNRKLFGWSLPLFCHSPVLSFVLDACVFFPAEVLSWEWGTAVGPLAGSASSEGRFGVSLDFVSWSILLVCSGLNFSMMWGFKWGPSSSYRKAKFVIRSSSDMLMASLAWMTPMFHWALSLRGTEGAVCKVIHQVRKYTSTDI